MQVTNHTKRDGLLGVVYQNGVLGSNSVDHAVGKCKC